MREIKCAFCESTDVELFSLFGQTLLGSQYYCRSCRSIFEAVRFDDDDDDEQTAAAKSRPSTATAETKREQEEN